jgi:GNAT superfamily N-acetyltransferase
MLQGLVAPHLLLTEFGRLREFLSSVQAKCGYELRPIVVVPTARGTGLAGALLKALITDARTRGYSLIHLYAEQDNIEANTFYLKSGFIQTGLIERNRVPYWRYERMTTDTV